MGHAQAPGMLVKTKNRTPPRPTEENVYLKNISFVRYEMLQIG
jgi:hypothetical protein